MYARARRLAYDLLVPASAEGAARGARTIDGPGVLEGLCALAEQAALDDGRLTAGVAALRSIGVRAGPRAREALLDALVAPAAALRSEAARALIGQADEACAGPLIACLRSDDAPIVRQAALRALARLPVPRALSVVYAFDDPVWRVRRDAAHLLMAPRPRGPGIGAASPPATLRALDEAVAALGPPTDAVRGVLEYVRRHAGIALASGGALSPQAPPSRPSYWDEDPAVLLENVRREGDRVLDEGAALVADLLAYQESRPYTECALRLRAWAAALLDRAGRPADFVPIVALLDEPRRPFVGAIVAETLGRLDAKRRAAVAARLLDGADGVDALLAARHPAPRRAVLRRLADAASRPGVGVGVGLGAGAERFLFAALHEDDDEARVVALGALQGAPWASVVAAARPEGGPLWQRAYLAARVARGDAFECEAAALEAQAGDARTRASVAA
nr:HEAT repeat domain-containing protein [Polyangiaceae bacterium]